MFAIPPRAGSICGWNPSNDSNDTLCTTLSTTSSYALHAYPSLPLTSTPPDIRNPIPRSLSLDSSVRTRSLSNASDTSSTYAASSTCVAPSIYDESSTYAPSSEYTPASEYTPYTNPTSKRRYKIKRQLDPSWAPRPPNAFILFRCDYVEKHKGEHDASDPESKTLSKRAGDAWKALSESDKKPWFELSKEEAMKHAAANPNYVYRPKKNRAEPRRHPAFLSRREQVEEFVRKSTRRRAVSSLDRRSPSRFHCDCPTPGSAGTSSSPEPPGTPSSEESASFVHAVLYARPRSDSVSDHLSFPMPTTIPTPYRPFMSHQAMVSMPSLVSERPGAPKRSLSHSDMPPYSMSEYVNLGNDHSEADEQSIFSFDSAVSEPSPAYRLGDLSEQPSPVSCEITIQNPEGQFVSQSQLGPDQCFTSQPPAMPESIDPLSTLLPPSTNTYPTQPTSPLFERRRRAATISTLPSPLTVVTSSLSGWARDDLVTARLAPRMDQHPAPPAPLHNVGIRLMSDTDNWTRNVPPNMHDTLAATIPETDMDITPRVPVFPQNLQDSGLPPPLAEPRAEYAMPEPQQDALPMSMLPQYELAADDITSDLDCYSMGLRQYGIGGGVAETANYGAPSFEVDYSSFLSCDRNEL
ncbi:hypothetical protein BN946_scf184940.g27 [Trametes cinnabarina]|uniref:HMG box domain-containing protein n=1 Tax=Pycnoporus cinnabarinus TaxID=5643 RepID=A0A060SC04_PYCCI|nr:hypothetical protein BN946_scf184940.g27 [Trametes cinnabarina]